MWLNLYILFRKNLHFSHPPLITPFPPHTTRSILPAVMHPSQPCRPPPPAGTRRPAGKKPPFTPPNQPSSPSRQRVMSPTIVILAGGLSSRMGRDKSTLPWGRLTLLEHVRRTARETGWPVRVVRHDLVSRCGPLGGVYTAFQRCRACSLLFLACDMPLVTTSLLARVWRRSQASRRAVFTLQGDCCGFPFVLRRNDLATVERHLRARKGSLQALAVALQAESLTLPSSQAGQLANLNTPEEWAEARRRLKIDTP